MNSSNIYSGLRMYRLNTDHTISKINSEEDLNNSNTSPLIKRDVIGRYIISTVFLGIDLNYDPNKLEPAIFETMIFDNAGNNQWEDLFCFRYATYDDALKNHTRLVNKYTRERNKRLKLRQKTESVNLRIQ